MFGMSQIGMIQVWTRVISGMPRGRGYAYAVSEQDFELFPMWYYELAFIFFNVEIIVATSGSVTQFLDSQFPCWLS